MATGGGGGMGRLLGLGFMFGAKDKGAVKVTKEIGGGFEAMGDSIGAVGKETTGLLKFGNVINSLNFLQVHKLTDAMEGLAQKAGLGDAAQANQIESWGIQFGKSYREATAGLGKFKGAVDAYKGAISGTSFTLEVDAGEMTKAIALITKTGNKLEDYGLNVRQVGGLMQSGILNGEQLANVLTGLSEGYELGAEGAGKLLDEIAKIGEMSGAGADAIRMMPDALKAADAAIAGLPDGMAGSVEDTVKSLNILAASTQKVLGGPYEESFQAATDVMQMLTDSRKELARTFTGLGGEFPELTSRLAETYGSVDKAFEVMSGDPALFVEEMQKIYSTLDETRKFRLLEQLPESMKFMVKAGAKGADTIKSMRGPIEGASGALGKMAKAASGSTRTFAEQMDLLEERFSNKLNKMTSQTDQAVVKRQKKAWDRLGKTLENLRKKGGPIAGVLQLFLDIRRHGFVHGIIPSLEKVSEQGGLLGKFAGWMMKVAPLTEGWGEGIIDLVTSLGPMIIALKYLGGFEKVSGMFGKLGGVTKILSPQMMLFAGAGYLIYKNWDSIKPMFEGIWDVLKSDLMPVFEELKMVAQLLWDNVKVGVGIIWDDYLKPFGKWVYDNLPAFFASATESIITNVAYLKFAIKAFAVKSMTSISVLKASWKAFAVIIETRVARAFDTIAEVFTGLYSSWNIGFLRMKKWLVEIPLYFAKFIQSLAQKLPPKLVSFFGLEGAIQGIDKTVNYYKESVSDANKALKDAIADREYAEDVARARKRDRDKKEFAAIEAAKKGIDAEMRRHDMAMAEHSLDLEMDKLKAMRAGNKVQKEILAARNKEVPKTKEAPKRRRRRGKTAVAAQQDAAFEAQAAAAEPFMLSARKGYGAASLDDFMKKQSFSKDGVKQLAEGMETGFTNAIKKLPKSGRGVRMGGAEREE